MPVWPKGRDTPLCNWYHYPRLLDSVKYFRSCSWPQTFPHQLGISFYSRRTYYSYTARFVMARPGNLHHRWLLGMHLPYTLVGISKQPIVTYVWWGHFSRLNGWFQALSGSIPWHHLCKRRQLSQHYVDRQGVVALFVYLFIVILLS